MESESVSLAEGMVRDDLACSRCGYNLWTISSRSVCPECGQPVPVALEHRSARRGGRHVDAGPGYGRWMRRLSHAMLLAVLAAVVGVWVPLNGRWMEAIDVAAAATVWTLGCWALWAAGAAPGAALPHAPRRRTAPLRAATRIAAVMAMAWPVVLQFGDRLLPIDPAAQRVDAIARALSLAPGVGSVAFFLYVALLARQTFHKVAAVQALVLSGAAAVVTLACAADAWPFDRWRGSYGFVARFGHHYLPVAGPVRSGLISVSDFGDWNPSHIAAHLSAVVLLWSVPLVLWTAFTFAWTARCYELEEMRGREIAGATASQAPAAAPGERSAASSRP